MAWRGVAASGTAPLVLTLNCDALPSPQVFHGAAVSVSGSSGGVSGRFAYVVPSWGFAGGPGSVDRSNVMSCHAEKGKRIYTVKNIACARLSKGVVIVGASHLLALFRTVSTSILGGILRAFHWTLYSITR